MSQGGSTLVSLDTRSRLGHGARRKRLLRVSDAFGKAPSASFPALFHDPKQAKRGYEFLGNPAVLPDDVLGGHVLNTLDRCASHRRVLLVMDMTELDYTHHRATRGLGSIGDGNGRGVHVLSVLALDASTGEPLGVLPPQRWGRPAVPPELARVAGRNPDKPALVFFERALTYAQVMHQAEGLAATLHRMGVKKGDRVALIMQNSPQWVIAHFAILRANAVVVPVNPMNRAEELKHYITDPDTEAAIVAADLAPELIKANEQLAPAEQLKNLIVTHYSDGFDISTTFRQPASVSHAVLRSGS